MGDKHTYSYNSAVSACLPISEHIPKGLQLHMASQGETNELEG